MSDQQDELLTIDLDATNMKAVKRADYRLPSSGKIPAFKLDGTWRFRRAELDQGIASSISTAVEADIKGGEE